MAQKPRDFLQEHPNLLHTHLIESDNIVVEVVRVNVASELTKAPVQPSLWTGCISGVYKTLFSIMVKQLQYGTQDSPASAHEDLHQQPRVFPFQRVNRAEYFCKHKQRDSQVTVSL